MGACKSLDKYKRNKPAAVPAVIFGKTKPTGENPVITAG
jgi:hypothetical protein